MGRSTGHLVRYGNLLCGASILVGFQYPSSQFPVLGRRRYFTVCENCVPYFRSTCYMQTKYLCIFFSFGVRNRAYDSTILIMPNHPPSFNKCPTCSLQQIDLNGRDRSEMLSIYRCCEILQALVCTDNEFSNSPTCTNPTILAA